MDLGEWFLTADERGNPFTSIDIGRPNPWTEGSHVEVLVDGATYFSRLLEVSRSLKAGDRLVFTDWQGDADERLEHGGPSIGDLLASLAAAGVVVRGLLWRSHPRFAHFGEEENVELAAKINQQGGGVVLDERVRRGGSHHQKLVLVSSAGEPDGGIAFVGGIDLSHGRRDDHDHDGDAQPVEIDDRYGPTPPWHDVQLEVRGPAIVDLEHSFRERWDDPTPLDHRNPWRRLVRAVAMERRQVTPLPWSADRTIGATGTHAVQVLRTYPAKRPSFPFAPNGERSIAAAYLKAFARARSLIYLEDQYLWSFRAAQALADALTARSELRVVAVVPRYPDRGGSLASAANRIGREQVIDILETAGGERVSIFDLENTSGTPIYVHAKVCVIDDVWMITGSDNLNRRSWTHDSELTCAIVDSRLDVRDPPDPGGLGDGARLLARETRLRLWREHLARDVGDDQDLIDPSRGVESLSRAAAALDLWYRSPGENPRPPGHLRRHLPERVPLWKRPLARLVEARLLDPDGRSRTDRRASAL